MKCSSCQGPIPDDEAFEIRHDYAGRTWYFCSRDCYDFDKMEREYEADLLAKAEEPTP